MRDFLSRVLLSSILVGLASAQAPDETDPARIADAKAWTHRDVGVGIELRQRWFAHLFTGPQSVTVLALDGSNEAIDFDVEAPGKLVRTSEMAHRGGALCAINGGFFEPDASPRGLLRLDGTLRHEGKGKQGCVGVLANGDLRLAQREAGDWPEVREALGAGVVLVEGGKVVDHGERQRGIRHPRSAIGTTKDGRILLVAIDGRTDKAKGTSYEETAQLLIALGCEFAINLDGGGSTTIWVEGLGVCNHPCDNRAYDHAGERAVANALFVRAPAIVEVDDDDAKLTGGDFEVVKDGKDVRGKDCARFLGGDDVGHATFTAALPFAGRWRARVWMPTVKSSENSFRVAVTVDDKQPDFGGAPIGGAVGAWTDVGTIETKRPGKASVHVTSARGAPFVVDAVQFVQVPAK